MLGSIPNASNSFSFVFLDDESYLLSPFGPFIRFECSRLARRRIASVRLTRHLNKGPHEVLAAYICSYGMSWTTCSSNRNINGPQLILSLSADCSHSPRCLSSISRTYPFNVWRHLRTEPNTNTFETFRAFQPHRLSQTGYNQYERISDRFSGQNDRPKVSLCIAKLWKDRGEREC